jgi:hypothetical protein
VHIFLPPQNLWCHLNTQARGVDNLPQILVAVFLDLCKTFMSMSCSKFCIPCFLARARKHIWNKRT